MEHKQKISNGNKKDDDDDDDVGDHGAAHLARPFNGITVLLQGIREPATQATVH